MPAEVALTSVPAERHPLISAQRKIGILLATPAAILLLSLVIGPTALVALLSLTDYQLGMAGFRYVGLNNYSAMLSDADFHRSMVQTAIYAAIVVPLSFALGLLAALLIEARLRLKIWYRALYFLPVAGTLVALATAWQVILHPSFGFLNVLLSGLGLEKTRFLSDPALALPTLAAIGVWQLLGFNMVLFLAGLSSIPRDLYEAAQIDGADSGWRRFLLVTWPMLGPVSMFVIVISVIRAFSVFETVVVMTDGGPAKTTSVVLFFLYEQGYRFFKIGYASAVAVSFFVIVSAFALLQARFLDRRVHYR